MEGEDRLVGLDHWRRSWVAELRQVEVGVVVLVGFEVQIRRERIAKSVGQRLDGISKGINAKARTNRRLIGVQFILRGFFLSFFLGFLRVP